MNVKELAEQAGMHSPDGFKLTVGHMAMFQLEQFAKLVVANIDPKSFMTYHEGYEAGVAHGREECANICDANGLFMTALEIRARSKA